jgi:hypothetical protein
MNVMADLRDRLKAEVLAVKNAFLASGTEVFSVKTTRPNPTKDMNTFIDAVYDGLATSYDTEFFEKKDQFPDSKDGETFIKQTGRMRDRLAARCKGGRVKNVACVAHSGWARYTFSALLPAFGGREAPTINLALGGRYITPLHNCGVAKAKFDPATKAFTIGADVGFGKEADLNTFPNFKQHNDFGVMTWEADYRAGPHPKFPAKSTLKVFYGVKKRTPTLGRSKNILTAKAWKNCKVTCTAPFPPPPPPPRPQPFAGHAAPVTIGAPHTHALSHPRP